MKAYKVTLLVVDHDGIGASEIESAIENTHYPNRCIGPIVMATEERDIGEWHDDHPLNWPGKQQLEFRRLFATDSPAQWFPVVIGPNRDCGDRSLVDHLNAVGKWRFVKTDRSDVVSPPGSGSADQIGTIGEIDVRNARVDECGVVTCEAFVPSEYIGKYFQLSKFRKVHVFE